VQAAVKIVLDPVFEAPAGKADPYQPGWALSRECQVHLAEKTQ